MTKKLSMKVHIGSTELGEYEGLQYINGLWLRYIDFRIYEVHQIGFFRKRWVVEVFAGADTAAIGGGAVWYDRVSPEFKTETEAVKFLSEITAEQQIESVIHAAEQ